ncbi:MULTISPECIES: RNA polymerase sigma factor SigM [Mycobacterium]|uniref:ECF RNA polymerase sigma factor SigM n=1 Tax=Mycobacterium kiyosense TaxID=2871094 RepID=A0A9P3UWI5_9MYCO|nr:MULTISPECIES: RNA polymerase sigma factor SigM [Mycobacterium]BDB45804.1 ECF RNA polymerase sigma factor SigM [Mycobacterium kiyosense]BDE11411.1 ECF RNA polymerase sigma factor SigM [Mycobacterium sp. 20KCMC460]GLB84981.1 ECF RNA polymerase sigma factor SigM [Mycobacterium kiyosense]GLB92155.1 ECF RNA polymerase sigma factor SigM [Mycobacterium kiyosense]GLB98188.1 ECF RNA polymerase sigma factor SigM [Mycobacterium kiyosense]
MAFRQGARRRSDAELLTAHAAGDRHAFAELFARHHRPLYRLARLTSLNAEDADDALQEAMLSAHRGAGSFRHDAQVGSWLHRIVLNACLDRIRRSKARPAVPLREDYPAADRTAQADTAIVVQRALMRLPIEQRAAVVAVDMHGYSVAETAALLGVAEGTVKSRCSRARARLARLLGYLDAGAPGLPGSAGAEPSMTHTGADESRRESRRSGTAADG